MKVFGMNRIEQTFIDLKRAGKKGLVGYLTAGDPTVADSILDRLVHNAYKINLRGESMRKNKSLLTAPTGSG